MFFLEVTILFSVDDCCWPFLYGVST